jgi:23S rRNA-/tRNA-specific pseudouridylate synthase
MKVDASGLRAKTVWRMRGRGQWRGAPIAWLELAPLTGRTHQLRVHCASEGWPILGDAIYGERAGAPLQLLARRV